MVIDQIVAAVHYLLRDRIQSPLRLRPIRLPRIEPVHALSIHRIHVRHFLFKRSNIHQRQKNHRPRNLRRIEQPNQSPHRNKRHILRPMRSRNQRQRRSRLSSMHHPHRNTSPRIHPSPHLNHAARFLPHPRRRRPHLHHSLLPSNARRAKHPSHRHQRATSPAIRHPRYFHIRPP